jgi:hypothetical protein
MKNQLMSLLQFYMITPEEGPVGPKHVETRRYMNKIEAVTSVGFSFLIFYLFVFKKFWCQLPEDGEIISLKHV